MANENDRSGENQKITGLKSVHFADLIRASQLIFDPNGGVCGPKMQVDWQSFGIPVAVEDNLKFLGKKYQYSSPHLPDELIWEQLNQETRSWFLENKDMLWKFEEFFPALDED